jgi:antitoxin component YwqK of YwqJK toxin-antitoxin module/Tfp pilus assembly protein PilF
MTNKFLKILLTGCFVVCFFQSNSQVNALENSAEFIMKGIEYHGDQKYQSAVKQYEKVHRNDTNYALSLYEKSLSLLAGEDFKECIIACKEGVKLPPSSNEAYFYITYGSALSDLEDFDESIAIFKKGIHLYPHNSSLRFNLALVQLRAKKYDEGLNTLYKNLEDNPFHGKSHLLLGEIAKQKGYPTKTLLAYSMYLMMEDRSAAGQAILQNIDAYANSKMDDEGEYEGITLANDGFGNLDELVFNKIAINDKYKTPSYFKFPYVKQLYLISSSLDQIEADEDDFWIRFYIPLVTQLMADDEFRGFTSYLLRSGKTYNATIAKGIEKSSKDKSAFISWFQDNFTEMYAMHTVNNKKVQYHYDNGKLLAIGNFSSDSKEKTEDWSFFKNTGSLSAKGRYKNNEKIDTWKYYHSGNRLESWYEMKDGKSDGAFEEYNLEGILIKKGTYNNGLYEGLLETYYETGGRMGKREFSDGKIDGILEYYHKSGQQSVATNCIKGDLNGLLTRYNALGQKSTEIEYKDDEKNGYSKIWYSDGELKSNFTYKEGELNGPCKRYYRNGQLEEELDYTSDVLTGGSKSFFKDGTMSESSDFDENGKENGIFKEYYPNGKLYAGLTYKNGDINSYTFYDEDGGILSEGKKKGKRLNYLRIDSNGYKNIEGEFVKGVRDGEWKITGPRGVIYSNLNYDDGKLNGPQKRYFSHGQTSKEYDCIAGNIEGLYKTYANGNPSIVTYEGIFTNNNKEGRFLERNKMGTLLDEEYYVNGETDGWQVYHTQKGILARESYTKDGYFLGIITYDSSGKNGEEHWLKNGNGELKLYYQDGADKFIGNYANGSSHGSFTWYYPNGEIETKGQYVNDERQGQWTSYHSNRKVKSEKTYNFGDLQGAYTTYFEDGSVRTNSNYVEGYLEGTYKRYFYNQKLREESHYKRGDMHGIRKSFVPTGELAIVRYYIDDVLVSYSYTDSNGELTEPENLGTSSQTITAYFQNKKPSVTFTIEKDKLLDDFIWYYPDGSIFRKSSYANGVVTGEMTAFFPNGNKIYVYPHKYGEYHGACLDYYENGKLKQQLSYYCGEQEGKSTYFDVTGKLLNTVYHFDNSIYFEKP